MPVKSGGKVCWAGGSTAGLLSAAANVGTGTGQIFRDITGGNTLNLKTIKAGTFITVTNNADDVTISTVEHVLRSHSISPVQFQPDDAPKNAAPHENIYLSVNGFSLPSIKFFPGIVNSCSALWPAPYGFGLTPGAANLFYVIVDFLAPDTEAANSVSLSVLCRATADTENPDQVGSSATVVYSGITADRLHQNIYALKAVNGTYQKLSEIMFNIQRNVDSYTKNIFMVNVQIVALERLT